MCERIKHTRTKKSLEEIKIIQKIGLGEKKKTSDTLKEMGEDILSMKQELDSMKE